MTTIKIDRTLHGHLLAKPPFFHREYGNSYIRQMLKEDPHVSDAIDFDRDSLGGLVGLAGKLDMLPFYPNSPLANNMSEKEITSNELVIYFSFGRICRHLAHLDARHANRFGRALEVLNKRWEFELISSTAAFSFPPVSKRYAVKELSTNFDNSSSVNMSVVEIHHEGQEGDVYEALMKPQEPVATTHFTLKCRLDHYPHQLNAEGQHVFSDGHYFEYWVAEPHSDFVNYSHPYLK